ncbi:MAG: hypothetical protein AB1491_07980 [Thermodesulfobacteriota bacterium]
MSRIKKWSQNLLALLGGLLAALILLEVILRLFPAGAVYLSPQEMLATFDYDRGHGVYRRNQDVEMLMPYGGLVAVEKNRDKVIADPRRLKFKIDSSGFRNDADYHLEKYLLVGDSFIVGSGNTQADILSNQLRDHYHILAYNLAFPGALHSYVRFIDQFQKSHKTSDFKVLLFLFEGNDFKIPKKPKKVRAKKDLEPSDLRIIRKKIGLFFRELSVWRYSYSLFHILKQKYFPEQYDLVTILKIKGENGPRIGFLKEYIKVTERPAYSGGEEFAQKLAAKKDVIDCILFIPTKYRVYYDFLDIPHPTPLPNAQWDYLNNLTKELGIKCLNLTEPLQQESARLLKENKLTYWRDDTHWNQYGIAVAAKIVDKLIKAQ